MFSWVGQHPWLPIPFSYTFFFAKYNATTQSIYTAIVSNHFLAFIHNFPAYIYMPNYYSLVCFELYIEMFTLFFFGFLCLNFIFSTFIHDAGYSWSSFISLLSGITFYEYKTIHSLLIEIILVPVLATINNSSLNILLHGFG